MQSFFPRAKSMNPSSVSPVFLFIFVTPKSKQNHYEETVSFISIVSDAIGGCLGAGGKGICSFCPKGKQGSY